MKVAVIMGSDSDWPVLEPAVKMLKSFGLETEVVVASAHRTPDKVQGFAAGARERGVKVILAAAGAAAALPGVVASFTTLPVIGIPIDGTSLKGVDALYSIVQMPSGIPVGCMAINGAKNAAIFAAEILAAQNDELAKKLAAHRQKMAEEVAEKAARVQAKIN